MTPEDFIAKWRANTRLERAACQEHFIDLCGLLNEPTPNTDPTGATHAFEKGAAKATGGDGWADVWRKGCFAWEYKGKHRDLEAAHRQLLLYAGALGNPPLLVTCDMDRFVIRTNWTNAISERTEILLPDLCRDAMLTPHGKPAAWPTVDAIVGNPPFLGNKAMIGTLGEDYTARLRARLRAATTSATGQLRRRSRR